MKVVLASQNPHKLREIQTILSEYGMEVVLQSDLGLHIDVDETGETFEENSYLKWKQCESVRTMMPHSLLQSLLFKNE